MYTLSFMYELLKKKANGTTLPENWQKGIDEYIRDKNKIVEKHKLYDGNYGNFDDEIKAQYKQYRQAVKLHTYLTNYHKYKLPNKIHPAGMLQPGFVIEPIAKGGFIWNHCGLKGISKVEMNPDTKKHFINICGRDIVLEDNPITEFPFHLPDKEVIQGYLSGKLEVPTSKEIWEEVENYYRTFADLGEDDFYKVLTLYTFQTWLQDSINSVFYLAIIGAWGAGKTNLGELITNVSKHGFFATIPSLAFIARTLHRHKISLFIDELDSFYTNNTSSDDSAILSIIRQGYRKGARYPRINKDTLDPEFFNIYGSKIYTIYSNVEGALLNRSIPITTTESTDRQLPIINMEKLKYSQKTLNRLYLWYLDNSIEIVDIVDTVDVYNKEEYNRTTVSQTVSQKMKSTGNQSTMTGRNAELCHVMTSIAKVLGVDLGDDLINHIFKIKKEIEDDRAEIGELNDLRDLLVRLLGDYKSGHSFNKYLTEDGYFKIANKEVFKKLNEILRKEGRGVNNKQFDGLCRELKFERPKSKRKMKIHLPNEEKSSSRTCLIFNEEVCRKLGIKTEDFTEHMEQVQLGDERDKE